MHILYFLKSLFYPVQSIDGFHNKITMQAYVNPESPSSGSGYGLIRFKKLTNQVVFECWPRAVDVTDEQASQFQGWPITVKLETK